MSSDTKPVIVDPLGGIDQRWSSNAPQATRARDLWYDPRGAWQSAGGYKRIIRGPSNQEGGYLNPFRNQGAIESIHWFSQHTGARKWLIYINGSGDLYVFNPSTAARSGSPGDQARDRTGATITRSVVTSPWIRSQSACWGDSLYLINGIDRPVVFDGYFWDYAGWQGPAGTPTAVTMNSPHAVDSGAADAIKIENIGLGPTSETGGEDYLYARKYKMTWINNRGAESPLSEASEIIFFENIGGTTQSCGAHFAKVTLPIGPPETVGRRLYATQNLYDSSNTLIVGRDTQFYYHSDIPDNIGDTFMDSLPDGYLGALVDEESLGAWPVGMRLFAPFKNRMYGIAADGSIRYSRRGQPEVWPINNRIDVGDAYLGPPTTIYATRNVLVVAKGRGIYLINDDGVNEPVAETLTRESGWIAQNTIREVPGMGLVGLSESGITVLQGTLQNEGVPTQVLNAGVPLPDVFARINRSALLNACGAVYHRDKEYWLTIPLTGNANNNLVLVYHYEIRQWTTRENYPISCMLETPDAAGLLLFGSYASTTGVSPDGIVHLGIMVYSRGCAAKDDYADDPTPIEPLYETGKITIASQFRAFRPHGVYVRGVLHGDNKLAVNLNGNSSLTPWLEYDQLVQQQYPQEIVPVYGVATFDSGAVWQGWRLGTMRVDLSKPGTEPLVECTVTFSPKEGTRYMTLATLSLEIAPDDPVGRPLRPDGAT